MANHGQLNLVVPANTRKDQPHISPRVLPDQVTELITLHRRWVETGGTEGVQADFTGADLSRQDLVAVQLQNAKLGHARLRGADLTRAELADADLAGANLQGATLHQTDLHRANLAGANFRDAILTGADLTGTRGLLPGRLAGANLAGAKLPEEASKFEGLSNVTEASKTTQGLFYSILFVCAYAWLTVASTRDPQLLNNNTPVASRLPILGTDIPLVQFYLVAPLLLLVVFIYFHLCLQRLWEELGELPAVFPDGRPLDRKAYPWIFNILIRSHSPRLKEHQSPLIKLQIQMTILLGWGLVPFTILVLWGRYLRVHDWWITLTHIAIISISLGAGLGFRRLAGATLRGSEHRSFQWRRAWSDARTRGLIGTTVATLVLAVISYGSIEGVNPLSSHRGVKPTQNTWIHAADPRIWVPQMLHLCKLNPFAQLDDSSLSIKPPDWSGGLVEHEIDSVRGADCEGRNLRYALAYNTFGVNGYFKHSNAQGADFRTSDLRYADFREAQLSQVNFRETILSHADLRWTNLTGAKLISARAEKAKFDEAIGVEVDFSKANLTDANFTDAVLINANFTDAILTGTTLAGADLTGAKGMTQAQLLSAKISANTRLPAEFQDLVRVTAATSVKQNGPARR